MLADSLLSIPFWAEAVTTACYVKNRVLVTKPHNKTRYELLHGRTPSTGFMRPFGCLVTILNTLDSLGKFDGKVDEGFLVGYSVSSSGPTWLFDIDTLTKTINYQPVIAGNQSNPGVGVQDQFDAEKAGEEIVQQYVFFLVWSSGSINPQNTDGDAAFDKKEAEFKGRKPESEVNVSPSSSAQSKKHDDKTKREAKGKSPVESLTGYRNFCAEFKDFSDNSINEDNAASTLVLTVGQIYTNSTNTFSAAGPSNAIASPTHGKSSYVDSSQLLDDPNMPELEDITYSNDEDDVGHTQDEGIDYEEVFAPVARIEAIRLFLAYASFIGFMVYQMDVKSAFLYETIEEEVYVYQLLGFKDPDYPVKVYKVVKELYGLHQAPRAWYVTLANYLLENGFQRGKIDQTLFIKRQKGDILFVQIYVNDIIFGSTNKDLCKAFEKLMKDKFQMSLMGELTFFLGLQVKQKKDGIFISQDKYVAEILRKFGLTDGKSASTPIDTEKPLLKDLDGEDKVNDVTRLQALVDKKKVVIIEATIRDALRLDDTECVECLPNEEIFSELARIGYEKPFTKLTFYKAFFSKTPLFEGMIVEQQFGEAADEVHIEDVSTAGVAAEGAASVADDEVPAAVDEASIPSPPSPTQPPPPSQDIPSTSQVQLIPPPSPIAQPPSPQHQSQPSQNARIFMDLLQNLLDTCTTLTRRVKHLEHDKIAQALEIIKLKQRVKKLERRNKASKLKRLQKVSTTQRIETSDDTVMDDVSKQGRMIADMDADVDVTLKDVAVVAKDV
nr:copia protein [Tanacetum cinerariifolium]